MANTSKMSGSPSGGSYGPAGVGNTASSYREATIKGKFPSAGGGERSQGETAGTGSMYSAELVERPNMSNNRNQGPERAPSMSAKAALPVVSMGSRNTGKISG